MTHKEASNTILLITIKHRNQKVVLVRFDYNEKLKELLQKSAYAKWSQTHRSWYLPQERHLVKRLYNKLVQLGYTVNTKKLLIPKQSTDYCQESHKTLVDYNAYLKSQRLSSSTIKTYCAMMGKLARFMRDKPIQNLTQKDLTAYIVEQTKANKFAISTHRQFVSALLKLGEIHSLNLDAKTLKAFRPKKSKTRPIILSQEEVIELLRVTTNLKHRCAIGLLYSCGLRVGELLKLEIQDLNPERKQVHIRMGKGRKDRYVGMSKRFMPLLTNYLNTYQPKKYVFEGQPSSPYSHSSIRAFLQRSCVKAGIQKKVTPHTLRHSYATHMLENGIGLRHIQELLGHSKPETTMIYTHVARKDLMAINNPLDEAIKHMKIKNKRRINYT